MGGECTCVQVMVGGECMCTGDGGGECMCLQVMGAGCMLCVYTGDGGGMCCLPHTQSSASATGDPGPQSRAHPLLSSGYTRSKYRRTLSQSIPHRTGYSPPC